MKASRIRHASTLLGLLIGALLAVACTAPSGGASGVPDASAPADASGAPAAPYDYGD